MLSQPWRIELLGGFAANQGTQTVSRFRTQKTGALLAYLTFFVRRSHSREELVDLLWPDHDAEAGRASLRTALASLRRQLEPAGAITGSVLIADRGRVSLNLEAICSDVMAFETACHTSTQSTSAEIRLQTLTQAVDLYSGELLPGWYEEWIFPERERLSRTYQGIVLKLAQALEQAGQWETAVHYLRRWLASDRLNEEAHAALIRLYLAHGHPDDSYRQYQETQRLFRKELETEPSEILNVLGEQALSLLSAPAMAAIKETRGSVSPASPMKLRQPASDIPSAPVTSSSSPLVPTHLPLPLTHFFGRESEIMHIQQMLERSADDYNVLESSYCGTRCLTLTGAGGTGKTRLAIEVARKLFSQFHGGVTFVPLADVLNPSLIGYTIARELRLPPTVTISDPFDQVVVALSGPPVLLVLDNFEQLLGTSATSEAQEEFSADLAGQVVHNLLTRLPNLTCLITSRQRLDVEGEREYAVYPLPTPDHPGTPERMLEFASIQLFVDRAQAMRADFQLNERNATTVGMLCEKLEGIPLAIELAASWIGTLSPSQILERLARRFELLVGKRKGRALRHQTLWAAMEWSYHQLTPDLQRFYVQCCVFRGGWTVEAAEAVNSENSENSENRTLEALRQLHARSLVISEEGDGTTEMRFRMLETLREFGAEQMQQVTQPALSLSHAHYYAHFVEEAAKYLTTSSQTVWLNRLETEIDNLRAAFRWCLSLGGEVEIGLRMAGWLRQFWAVHGHYGEGRELLEQLFAKITVHKPTPWLAYAYGTAGALAAYEQDWTAAEYYDKEYLKMERLLENTLGIATALYSLGHITEEQQDIVSATTYYIESLAHYRAAGSEMGVSSVLGTFANMAADQRDYATALPLYQNVVNIQRRIGNKSGVAFWLKNLGLTYLKQDNLLDAFECIEESLEAFDALHDKRGIAQLLSELAAVCADSRCAVRLFGAALALGATTTATPVSAGEEVEKARHRLGEIMFESTLEEGRRMTLQQAIELALQSLTDRNHPYPVPYAS